MRDLKNIKGAIFDMDGTIIDSMQYWDQLDERFLTRRGFEYTEEVSQYLRTCSLAMSAEYFSKNYGIPGSIEDIIKMINDEMREPYEKDVTVKEGAVEFLEALKEKGVPMCIATSTDRELVELVLNRLDLMKYFGKIFTCSEIGKNKDHPDIFEEALSYLGTEREDTPIFEDSLYAMKTAKKAGYPVVAVADKSAEWSREEIQKIADIYVEKPGDLKTFF